ncbi:MAG: hypothetical protein HYZ28_01105 [Myxococcales bacterium]|nr:hypothetical protein [Myxococcales bacterium]
MVEPTGGTTNLESPDISLRLGECPCNNLTPYLKALESSIRLEDKEGEAISFTFAYANERGEAVFFNSARTTTARTLRILPDGAIKGWRTLTIPISPDWRTPQSRLDSGFALTPDGKSWTASFLYGYSRPAVLAVRLRKNTDLGADAAALVFWITELHFSETVTASIPYKDAIEVFDASGQRLDCLTLGEAGDREFHLKCSDRVARLNFTTQLRGDPGGVPVVGTPGPLEFLDWNHVVDRDGYDVYENPAIIW